MIAPPDFIVEAARLTALRSPCAKSKRGVVLFDRDGHTPERYDHLPGRGFNGQPGAFSCTGSAGCRTHCAKLCMHAEQRAIVDAMRYPQAVPLYALELVHVKVVNNEVVPGGGPSCWQCSRLVVEVGLRGVWLFEAQRWHDELRCRACSQITIVAQGSGTTGVCEQCDHVGRLLQMPGKRIYDPSSGEWNYYDALGFHEATLRACGIGDVR